MRCIVLTSIRISGSGNGVMAYIPEGENVKLVRSGSGNDVTIKKLPWKDLWELSKNL